MKVTVCNTYYLIQLCKKWKCVGNSAPGCNGHFDMSVSSFTMIHIEIWTMWQTYSRNGNKSVIYILADIPTSPFKGNSPSAHSDVSLFEILAHRPCLNFNSRSANHSVWLNILSMYVRISTVCCCSIQAPSLVEHSSSDLSSCLLGFPGTCLLNPDG